MQKLYIQNLLCSKYATFFQTTKKNNFAVVTWSRRAVPLELISSLAHNFSVRQANFNSVLSFLLAQLLIFSIQFIQFLIVFIRGIIDNFCVAEELSGITDSYI